MAELAWIVHRLPGRLRLRFPGYKQDVAFFAGLVEDIGGLPGVYAVRANPMTASLLIELDESRAQTGRLHDWFADRNIELQTGEPPPVAAGPAIREGLERLDHYVGLASRQATDLRSLGVLFFSSLALLQVARGQVLAPASSLLWYALDLLRDPAGRSSGE